MAIWTDTTTWPDTTTATSGLYSYYSGGFIPARSPIKTEPKPPQLMPAFPFRVHPDANGLLGQLSIDFERWAGKGKLLDRLDKDFKRWAGSRQGDIFG